MASIQGRSQFSGKTDKEVYEAAIQSVRACQLREMVDTRVGPLVARS